VADRAESESESGTAHVVGPVELPRVGEAARVTGAEMVSVTDDIKVEMLTMSTLVPVPATAGQFMLVTCCSPNLPLAEEVYELFDAITSTFYFVEPERTQCSKAPGLRHPEYARDGRLVE
jgi:hypothetical protein